MNVVKKWLIVVFIHNLYKDQDIDYRSAAIQEMEMAGTHDNTVLLVTESVGEGIAVDTVIEQLLPDPNHIDRFLFQQVKDLPDFRYGDKSSWSQALAWINEQEAYNSTYTVLITFSHGAGVSLPQKLKLINTGRMQFISRRYFPEVAGLPLVEKLHPELSKAERINLPDYIRVVKKDEDPYCKKLEMLWVSELADALKEGFCERKIDILMMANCYMQNFETGWLLRNQVDYLVASETDIAAYGYSFGGLLTMINDNSDLLPEKLALSIVPQFIGKWAGTFPIGDHFLNTTVMVNKLGYYSILKFYFEKIVDILQHCSSVELAQIIEIRKERVHNVTDGPPLPGSPASGSAPSRAVEFIDLLSFFTLLPEVFPGNDTLASLVDDFACTLRLTVLDSYVGRGFINNDIRLPLKFHLNGISIYLPSYPQRTEQPDDIGNCAYFGTPDIDGTPAKDAPFRAFTDFSLWDEFILRYIKGGQSEVKESALAGDSSQ